MDASAAVQSFPCNLCCICISPGDRSLLLHFEGKSPMGFCRRILPLSTNHEVGRRGLSCWKICPSTAPDIPGNILANIIYSSSNKSLTALGQASESCSINGWWKARNFSPDPSSDKMSEVSGLPMYIHAEEGLAVSFAALKGHLDGKSPGLTM